MRSYDAGTLSFLGAREGLVAHRLIWISARNTASGVIEDIGIWSGEDDVAFSIGGETRSYTGAGAVLTVEPIIAGKGLDVRITQISLSAVAPEVEDLVKGYDTRFAPVEMHRAVLRADTRQLVGAPHRVFRGMINSIEFPTGEPGSNPSCVISVASEARVLTRNLALKKSDETFQASGGDRFRQYADVSGSIPIYWGEMKVSAPADPKPKPPADEPQTDDNGYIIYPGR